MSARRVLYSQLSCDGCGVVFEHIGKAAVIVRDLAAKDGWKRQPIQYGGSNWRLEVEVDLCPACEGPK